MASTTPKHSLPYPAAGDPAVPHNDIKLLAEKLDTELDAITPGQIVGPTSGQLLIADVSGKVTGVAMSGDATITPAGALAIGPKKVKTAALDDKAVSTAKIDSKAVTRATTAFTFIQATTTALISSNGTIRATWPEPFSAGSTYITMATAIDTAGAKPIIRVYEQAATYVDIVVTITGSGGCRVSVLGIAI